MQSKSGSTAVSKRPAGGSSAATPSKSGNRTGGTVSRRSGGGGGGGGGANTGGIWRYYTDDAAGVKLSPTVVITVSFLFMVMVVFLHLFAKFRR
mmetsp:Transcript_9844/g.19225  ORF Transcript_9844/g.19225 Transcript_9844/m.19225 type:complete len:94 (+) Transcript_9844:459-740(+)